MGYLYLFYLVVFCWFQCTSGSEKREPLPSSLSDANHNSVSSSCSAPCSAAPAAGGSSSRCTSTVARESCCTAENQASSGHSDLGYASDGDCESCSSQKSLPRNESENSHSSGCCSPSSSAAAAAAAEAGGKYLLKIPPHLTCAATLPPATLMSENERQSSANVVINENLHI